MPILHVCGRGYYTTTVFSRSVVACYYISEYIHLQPAICISNKFICHRYLRSG